VNRDEARAVFSQLMGLVAVTIGSWRFGAETAEPRTSSFPDR
jgi:hypothetical protein